jgi:ribosomal protein L37AE/L43A
MDDGAPFATADCEVLTDDWVRIALTSGLTNSSTRGTITAAVRRAKNYDDKRRFSVFLCPRCERRCRHLVYTWHWRCDKCSGLLYRKQAVGSKVTAWEKRAELERLVGAGRPKGMHNATFAKLARELEQLVQRLGPDEAKAHHEYLWRLERTWGPVPGQGTVAGAQVQAGAEVEVEVGATEILACSPGPFKPPFDPELGGSWRETDDPYEL